MENEERLFGSLKDITLRTLSRRPGEVTYNAFIRLQEESKHNRHKVSTMENTISKHAASMSLTNTIVTKDMAKHSHHWQALLEWIADYLKEGPGVWWRRLNNYDIAFFDVSFPTNQPPDNPTLTNFRSTSTTQISAYLKMKWSECIQEDVTLPADTLHLDK